MHSILSFMGEADSVPFALLLISACAALGTFIGGLKIKGVGLGVSGVLFAGLILGHFGLKLNPSVLHFLRDFGLALFVYMTGLSVGPGFFSSLRTNGMRLNYLALSIVVLGTVTAGIGALILNVDIAAMVGVLCGATTNTPSLGAARQLLIDSAGTMDPRVRLPDLGYAVAYPFGVAGIIGSMLLLRRIFRADLAQEARSYEEAHSVPQLKAQSFVVDNPNLEGVQISDINKLIEGKVSISRVQHGDSVSTAVPTTVLHRGDLVHAVGTVESLAQFKLLIGTEAGVDISLLSSQVVQRTIVVTNRDVVDRPLSELNLHSKVGVSVTRLTRGEVELIAAPNLRLNFADTLRVVGSPDACRKTEELLGNSRKKLQTPDLLPIFIGLAAGVLLGSFPFSVPGIDHPVKLGIAGGPLLVALVISRLGQIGGMLSYFPSSALAALRELGILLFLACVGLKAGDGFLDTLLSASGLTWMLWGLAITMVPLLLVGIYARKVMKLDMLTIWGLTAGATTDPPALTFAAASAPSNSAQIAYATVYPLVMISRIVCAQLLLLALI